MKRIFSDVLLPSTPSRHLVTGDDFSLPLPSTPPRNAGSEDQDNADAVPSMFLTPPRNAGSKDNAADPLSMFSTPPQRRHLSNTMLLGRYRKYDVLSELAATPLIDKRAGHNYTLVCGLPLSDARPMALETFYPTETGWPSKVSAFDTETFVLTNSHRRGLRDMHGAPIVKLRVVLDCEGQLIFALNGSGSRTIPYHHQLSFSLTAVSGGQLEYETDFSVFRSVIFAGEIGFGSDNRIYYASNRSGHFKPGVEAFEPLWDYLAVNSANLAPTLYYQVYEPTMQGFGELIAISSQDIFARATNLSPEQHDLFCGKTEQLVKVKSKSPYENTSHGEVSPPPRSMLFPLDLEGADFEEATSSHPVVHEPLFRFGL